MKRLAVAADIDFDPTYRAQRHVARYLIGSLINQLRGREPLGVGTHYKEISNAEMAVLAERTAREIGIIAPHDGLHQAILYLT